ncbi:trypsin-1-like [Schistocerca piceifrons]|uniref:trypsin-1-like n=1 Tax=Schistocerca piceifrons TaxID=274613 RepID=UPI001F5ED332|nr:trypsin-1-like [Schistocerca piceifrons]
MRRRALLLPLLLLLLQALPASCATDHQHQDSAPDNAIEGGAGGRVLFNQLLSLFGLGGSDSDDEETLLRNCSCQCGVANHEVRIVGGRPTGVNRYPWVARLVYDGRFQCGASLLNGDYVLTAAHCLRRLKRSKIRIFLGDHDQTSTTDTPAIMRAVSSVIRHRNFDENTWNHDIALLRLRKPVNFSKRIRPVCLPPKGGGDPAGRTGTVVGWGRTAEDGALASVVQEAQVPILSLQQCRASRYPAGRITDNMLCAGQGSKDSCQGDSGGPLLVTRTDDRHEIVGVVSWGMGCGRPGYPGVYTRVSRYLDWVRGNMRDTCDCNYR